MAWGERDIVEQRIAFVIRADSGKEVFKELCEEFEISRDTGYEWLNRYREEFAFSSLKDRSRKPNSCPHKTSLEVERQVISFRKKYGWGAKKLRVLLEKKRGVSVPVATINRILKRNGLVDKAEVHHPAPNRFEHSKPNALWQIDFKGTEATVASKTNPLSVLDDCSRFVVGLHHLETNPAKLVESALERTFRRYGVPERILLDHGIPWWTSKQEYGLTRTAVWLIKQGIKLTYSRIRHPQTQGKVERFHRTLRAAIKHKKHTSSIPNWQRFLNDFRREYNYLRPHEALSMDVPASRYTASLKSYVKNPEPWDYSSNKGVIVKLDSQGKFKLKGTYLFVSEALQNEFIQLRETPHSILVAFRNMYVRELFPDLNYSKAFVTPINNL